MPERLPTLKRLTSHSGDLESVFTVSVSLSVLGTNGTVVDFQAFLISCLARDLGTRKCLYCLGRFLIKRGSILPGHSTGSIGHAAVGYIFEHGLGIVQ